MTCPGLHCPGCSGGQSLGILAGGVIGLVLAAETVAWVAEHVWEIGLTVAACFALAVAASIFLERWNDVRAARFAAAHGILSRADLVLPGAARHPAELAAMAEAGLPRPLRPAAEAAQPPAIVNHYHGPQITIYGRDGEEAAARIIRRALPAGDTITEGEQ